MATETAERLRDDGIADVSPETLRRALREFGLGASRRVRVPKHKEAILEIFSEVKGLGKGSMVR